MTDKKITDLTAVAGANLAAGDTVEFVDVSDTTDSAAGSSRKTTLDDIAVSTSFASRRARILDKVLTDAGSASSAAEQTLASLTLPAGVVAAGDILRCVFFGDRLNNSGSTLTSIWKFKIGATTLHNTGTLSAATGPNRTPWSIYVDVMFTATNAQRALFQLAAATSGTTAPQTSATQSGQIYGTAAEDSTSALTVALTCQLGASSASADVILHAASMMLVKA